MSGEEKLVQNGHTVEHEDVLGRGQMVEQEHACLRRQLYALDELVRAREEVLQREPALDAQPRDICPVSASTCGAEAGWAHCGSWW